MLHQSSACEQVETIDAAGSEACGVSFRGHKEGVKVLVVLVGHIRPTHLLIGAVHHVIVAQCGADGRSEEHTSELQSLMRISYAVFCLKKKNKTNHTRNMIIDKINK